MTSSASHRPLALELRGASVVRGGRTTLQIDGLAIESGELVAVVGPNGSGKSTLLQVVNGLLPPASGEVTVLGETLRPRTALHIRRRCALVLQEPLLLHTTVFGNVALAPRFRGYSRERADDHVWRALRAFRCEHLASRPAHQLSGGEVQRVCLARALVCDPELVMLDEPFTALDAPTRSALVRELRDIALQRGTTVVLVTHDFDDVLSFAHRALVMVDGRIVQDAAPEVVLRKPVDTVVARLVSMDNILVCEAEAADGGTRIRLGGSAAFVVSGRMVSGTVTCCLPGDALSLHSTPPGAPLVSLEGRVAHVVPGLGQRKMTVDCGEVQLVVRAGRNEGTSFEVGHQAHVAFDPASVHLVFGGPTTNK